MSGPSRAPAGEGERWAVAFVGSRVLLVVDGERARLPTASELTRALGADTLTVAAVPADIRAPHGTARAFRLAEGLAPPDGFRLEGLRDAYLALAKEEFRVAATARQKTHWHETHLHCSRCGAPTERHPTHEAMACTSCGQLHFPRIAPAAIVLVQRGPEALLARSHHFTPGVYSALAGFVEPGETLEECAHREIEEEVGVRIDNLRYFGSQPHPFPHSLMVGFVADWRSGDIRIDPTEIEDARWFAPDALPALPSRMSIARALIDDFVRRAGS